MFNIVEISLILFRFANEVIGDINPYSCLSVIATDFVLEILGKNFVLSDKS